MASVTRDMVITRVKSLIDELTAFTDGTLQAGSTLSSLDVVKKYIDSCLNEATDAAMLVCNSARLPRTALSGTASNMPLGTSGIVYQTLAVPSDFLRIIFVKMTKWEKGVTTLISTDSETYRQMRNPHTLHVHAAHPRRERRTLQRQICDISVWKNYVVDTIK